MGDFVKIAVKTALVASICVAIYQLFVSINISLPTLTYFSGVVGKGKTIFLFYLPWLQNYWSLFMTLIDISLGIWGFYFAMLAVRWILKVNE